MARIIKNYNYKGITLQTAYLRVTTVSVNSNTKFAMVSYAIYPSKEAREADATNNVLYEANQVYSGDTFTSTFTGDLAAGEDGKVPSTPQDVIWSAAYAALLADSTLTALFVGSTAA